MTMFDFDELEAAESREEVQSTQEEVTDTPAESEVFGASFDCCGSRSESKRRSAMETALPISKTPPKHVASADQESIDTLATPRLQEQENAEDADIGWEEDWSTNASDDSCKHAHSTSRAKRFSMDADEQRTCMYGMTWASMLGVDCLRRDDAVDGLEEEPPCHFVPKVPVKIPARPGLGGS